MAEQTTLEEPELHKDGVLTLEGMKATIAARGMVLHKGKFLRTVDELPTAAELAKGDLKEEKKVAADLQRQMSELQAQLDELKKPATSEELGEKDYTPSEFVKALSGYIFIGEARAKALLKAGLDSRDKVLAVSDEDLAKIKGFETPESIKSLRDLLTG